MLSSSSLSGRRRLGIHECKLRTEGRDGVVVEEARDGDGDEDARAHDDGEDHGPENLDGVEDEQLFDTPKQTH